MYKKIKAKLVQAVLMKDRGGSGHVDQKDRAISLDKYFHSKLTVLGMSHIELMVPHYHGNI